MILDRWRVLGKIGLLVFLLATVLYLVAFSLPGWMINKAPGMNLQLGLWRLCSPSKCTSTTSPGKLTGFAPFVSDRWFKTLQALSCLALSTVLLDIVLRALFLFRHDQCPWGRGFYLVSIALDFVAAVLALAAAGVAGKGVAGLEASGSNTGRLSLVAFYRLHTAFALDIASGVLFLLTGLCMLGDKQLQVSCVQ